MNKEETVNRILANFRSSLSADLVSGQLCGLACDVCPLRAWKSPVTTAISVDEVLFVEKQRHTLLTSFKTVIRKMKSLFDLNINIKINTLGGSI